MTKLSVMFVCLGNICRSPLAEAVLKSKLETRGLQDQVNVESSGTARYHIGDPPDARTQMLATRNNIKMKHLAQQFKSRHFGSFDYIIVMDDKNLHNVEKIKPDGATSRIFKLRFFDEFYPNSDVPDPWFGDRSGFDENFRITDHCCNNLMEYLLDVHEL